MYMKPNGTMKFLNKQPHILFSHRDLSLVKHIVALAPQEAQWFHCVERVISGNNVYYKLTEMLIPEQYCSAAEVDTSSEMMVSFYKQIKEQFGEETNNIMSKMTCWCHSHHNMGVSPSGQDRKQFKEQVELAHKRQLTSPQIMIIFNKTNDYYCQIYDPELDIHVENAPIVLQGYDFSAYSEIAKTNFKKKVFKPKQSPNLNSSRVLGWSMPEYRPPSSPTLKKGGNKKKTKPVVQTQSYLEELKLTDKDIISTIESIVDEDMGNRFSQFLFELDVNATTDYNKLLKEIESYLSAPELIALDILLNGNEEEIRLLEDSFPDELDSGTDTEKALISLYQFFSDNAVSEDDFFTAIAIAKLVTDEKVSIPRSERLIDYWIDFYNASTTIHFSWENLT